MKIHNIIKQKTYELLEEAFLIIQQMRGVDKVEKKALKELKTLIGLSLISFYDNVISYRELNEDMIIELSGTIDNPWLKEKINDVIYVILQMIKIYREYSMKEF